MYPAVRSGRREALRAALGGMRFVGLDGDRLIFARVRELHPEEQLSPARSHTMTLSPEWVASILVDGRAVWPHARLR